MTVFSRRQFLQLAGIALLGTQIDPARFFTPLSQSLPPTHAARTLIPASVHRAPNAQVTAHLWPDSVVSIHASEGHWYKLPQGYVVKTALQPMALYETPPQIERPIFWAEVAGPVAAVREWCAADAPLVTRIGHGGVMKVVDFLPGEPVSWYGIAADDSNLLGWTPASHWRRAASENPNVTPYTLEIDQQHYKLTIYQGRAAVLHAPVSIGQCLTPGTYSFQRGQRSSIVNSEFYGVPWQIRIGDDCNLNGVYWHNQFGTAVHEGPAIQVTPMLARWLYHHLGDNGFVTIV
jgi:hypothetical protein